MALSNSGKLNSTQHISRSEVPAFSSASILLSTRNTIRIESSAPKAAQRPIAVSLPFIVTSSFLEGDPNKKNFYHLPPDEFPEIDSDLGSGASFIVQKVHLSNIEGGFPSNTAVALKRIRPSGPKGLESFHSVVKDLLCLLHPPLRQSPNVVRLLGLGWETSPSELDGRLWPYLILEYSSIGSLAELQSGSQEISHTLKKKLALDVAQGLYTVHCSKILHGDVKSENVLIFLDDQEGYTAKLSDFGFAILDIDFPANKGKISINEERETASISTGTPPWTAPEFGKQVNWEAAFKSDVYSYGLLVWRVFLNGLSPFSVFRSQFDPSTTSVSASPEDIRSWKERNLILPVALSFAEQIQNPMRRGLENAFRHTLSIKPEDRDLRLAYLPWRYGDRGYHMDFNVKLPLNRRIIYQKIRINTLQGYKPRLRQQFLRDLDDLGKLSSPLQDEEGMYCPTNLASMTIAEYHIATNNLGLAYNHLVRAAKRGYAQAFGLVARLEHYHGSFDLPIDIGDYPADLAIKACTMKPPARAMKWLYQACCMCSVSALETMKRHDIESYEAALKVTRSIAMGGIDIDLISAMDLKISKQKGRVTAATEAEETMSFRAFPPPEVMNWILSGPVVGLTISPLHVASAKGLIQPISSLLADGCSVNSKHCPEGCTPILLACISGSLEAVRLLLTKGADPTIGNNNNETPLHWLSTFDKSDVSVAAKLLLRNKSQLSALADGGSLPVEGDVGSLALARGTPLHRAIGRRDIGAVQSLLSLGADPLLKDQHGVTPLALATTHHLTAIMELLHSNIRPYIPNHDHGPNLRLFNFAINSADPITLFMIHGDHWLNNAEKTLRLLLTFGESLYGYCGEDNFILNTIFVGNYRMAKVLLDNGATEHVEKVDYEFGGDTALMCAVSHGQRHIFTELLKHGASIHTRLLPATFRRPGARIDLETQPNKSTLIHYCAELGSDTFFLDEFIKRGLPINQSDAEWNTALSLALKSGHMKIASRLIDHGATLSEVKDGVSLLGQLAEQGLSVPKERYRWIFERLQETHTSGFLTSPKLRQSIFHHIAQDKRTVRQPVWARDLISFFIERVSDMKILDLQDVMLNSALHLAVQSQNIEVANALLEAGARPDLLNMDGKSPLDIASENTGPKSKDIIRILNLHKKPPGTEEAPQTKESAMALWKELGFQQQLQQWLDTALIPILEELRQTMLTLCRSEGFLLQENPWKPATRAVYEVLNTNRAILDREERIRQFEYAVGEMLRGLVDSVTVGLKADREQVIIKLVKPLDGRAKFPPNLLNEDVTSMVLLPEVGQSTFQHSYPGVSFSRSGTSTNPKQPVETRSPELLSEQSRKGGSTLGNWIRLRRLDQGRFIIEDSQPRQGFLGLLIAPDPKDHENRFVFRQDTGIMLTGDDSEFMRRQIVDTLLDCEPVVEIIDTTEEGQTHRSATIAGLKTLSAAYEERKKLGPSPASLWRRSDSQPSSGRNISVPASAPARQLPQSSTLPDVNQRKNLSKKEQQRLRTLLRGKSKHIITEGDELEQLLFDYTIPKGAWIFVSALSDTFGMAMACRHDNEGNEVEMDARTALVANQFTMSLEF